MTRFKEPAQLHVHSSYSLLDAVASPKEWLEWCLNNDTPGISITDHGTAVSLYDIVRFPKYIEDYNKENKTSFTTDAVIGIPGIELYVKMNDDKEHYHLNAWAISNEGYSNLMQLSSLSYQDTVVYYGSIKGRVTLSTIQKYRSGLRFGTACIASPIGAAFQDGDLILAETRYKELIDLFGDDLYIEFHPADFTHDFNKKTGGFDPLPLTPSNPDGNMQKAFNNFLLTMVEKYGGKPIPATDAHFIKPEDKIIQDCLLKNGNSNGWYFHGSYHQKRSDEIYDKLKEHLGNRLTEDMFLTWIENTYEVMNLARSIKVKYDYHLPKIPIPEHISSKVDDYNEQTYYFLMERIKFHGRWNPSPEYIERFKKEIDVIMKNEKLNFIPYFLVYEDIACFARSQGILQNIGRGSAGGSLISYYLKIIHVDPIKANLPFERFLSHARIRAGSFPDIDMDIGDQARPAVMQYLKDKYKEGFAQIATFNKMKTKNAIKDAMFAVYGRNRNDPEIKEVCDSIPDSLQGVDEHDFLYGFTDQEDNYNPGQLETNKIIANFFKRYPDIESMVKRLIGLPRGWSRHASAFVISTINISGTRVPTMIMKDKNLGDITVTQYDASMVEKCNLVKADILGVKTLTAVSLCVQLVKDRGGINYLDEDQNGVALVYRLPEDVAVYRDFFRKDTDSSFQFNTPLIKGYIQEFNPQEREDLSILTSLCRPGALDAPLFDTVATQYYLDIRNKKRRLEFLHDDLAPIVGVTNGVLCYQEQVMKFLVDIVGYTWEESDQIRSAIAKKKHEVIMKTFDRIRQSTKARGWTEDQSETICQQVQAFSNYSFNRSHAKCYSELGYITMYLKHHHPLEWWASTLNVEKDEDKIRKFISKLGDMIRPPSLKNPSDTFTIYGNKIYAPLSIIKRVGVNMVSELTSHGQYESLEDFMAKVNHSRVNIGGMGALIRARAIDDFLDSSKDYAEERKAFMNKYLSLRKTKSAFPDDLWRLDPLSIFMMERAVNQGFNKVLLDDTKIVELMATKWHGLKPTGKKEIPFTIGRTPVIASCATVEHLVDNGFEDEVAMILLFEESTFKSGISKKSGRPWHKVEVKLSDGHATLECTDWDRKKALTYEPGTLIFVRGRVKRGWKDALNLTIEELEVIE